jgi:hypothetical protein
LSPGESIEVGLLGQGAFFGDDPAFGVDNDIDDGVVYLSDGSYFNLLGVSTLFIVGSTTQSFSNYDCIVSGPFIGITNYKHGLEVTKNARMVEDLRKSYNYNINPSSFEKQLEKYTAKYENAVEKRGDEPFINHYIGSTFGPYVFEAKGQFGDTLTLFESKTVKTQFRCAGEGFFDNGNKKEAAITVSVTNPYKDDLAVFFDVSSTELLEDDDDEGFYILSPGESIEVGLLGRESFFGDDFGVDDDNDDGVVYLSDGSYFTLFGEQTLFIVGSTTQSFSNYDCIVSGPYMAGLPHGDVLKNTYRGPVGKDVFRANKLLPSMNTKNFEKRIGKLQNNIFKNQSWK